MRIAVDVNGVLRDTIKKIEQVYEKWYIENPHLPESGFTYEILSPITSLDISSHLKFENEDEVYDFLYTEHCMEIFGHAPSVAMNTFIDFDEFYKTNREKHDILIISDEIGRSKPATLFFLSKFGCLVENIKFYSSSTIKNMWNTVDVLLTANPELMESHPENVTVVQYVTEYNKSINNNHKINTLKDFDDLISKLKL